MSVFLFILSLSAFAAIPPYELINFASGERRSPEDLLKETSKTLEDLKNFHCESNQRGELFFENMLMNLAADSLKIVTTHKKKQVIYTYRDGKVFLNGKKTKARGSYAKKTLKALKKLSRKSTHVKKLLSKLQMAPAPFYIKFGRNQYTPNMLDERSNEHGNEAGFVSMMDDRRPMVEGMVFEQIGFTGQINWNPGANLELVEIDYVKRSAPSVLALAHELFHAYDGMRGLLDRRFVKGEGLEFVPVAEYRAVYFENLVRKDLGLKYRRFYSGSKKGEADLLDENNQPILLPTPCIHWL